MSYPDSFPKHFIGISTSILTMQGSTTHVIVWKIRVILLQIFAWIVALKVREHLTGYLRKDIKYRLVTIGAHTLFSFLQMFQKLYKPAKAISFQQ